VVVASAGPYASLHLTPDNHASTPLLKFSTGQTPFLPPNQQHQSIEGTALKAHEYDSNLYMKNIKPMISNQ